VATRKMYCDKITTAFWNWTCSRKGNNKMTKTEWIDWWEATGKFDQRGPSIGQYYMNRIDKTLPFIIGNIELRQRTPGKRNKRDYGHIFN
jgi:hypothetical protein